MKNKKYGFTLIELLAVIIILGILMVIAIPSVTSYISSSRKSAYVTTAMGYVDSARVMVNSGKFEMYDPDATFYVPKSCITLESGGNSPYAELNDAYVGITYLGNGFDYYWMSRDEAKQGMYLTYIDILSNDKIASSMKEIYPTIAVGDRSKVGLVSSEDCSTITYAEPTGRIAERGFDLQGPGNRVTCELVDDFHYSYYWGEENFDDHWEIAFTAYYNEDYTLLTSIEGHVTQSNRNIYTEDDEYIQSIGGLQEQGRRICENYISNFNLTGVSCNMVWGDKTATGYVSVSNFEFLPTISDALGSENLASITTSTKKDELIPLLYKFFINDYARIEDNSIDFSKKYTKKIDYDDGDYDKFSFYCY